MGKQKVGIMTLNSNNNFGNKLQNYALKKSIEKYGYDVDTLWFYNSFKNHYKSTIKYFFPINKEFKREKKFEKFTKDFLDRKYYPNYDIDDKYNKFVVGSDQVWNYKFKGVRENFERYFLNFSHKEKNFSYAASISTDYIDKEFERKFIDNINNIRDISVREEQAEVMLKKVTKRTDIQTLIDPTMLLSSFDWDKIIKEPKKIGKYRDKKYILNYFLGELSIERKTEIERFAKENDCIVINILDRNDIFYINGPREFLYLIKHAYLICTDSFHSSVFSILYNKPFLVFERENNGWSSMNSRIDTLLSKFKLNDRKYNESKITNEDLIIDYNETFSILEKEREKSADFLKKALDIK